jgi:short subunit dehydrogenase-like uncharacterized protein
MNKQWMIYGANGYTGELIARRAVAQGLKPMLAGRGRDKVEKLATELGLEFRAFGLDDADKLDDNMGDMAIVLHCAGPFSVTAKPMMQACIRTQTHYLDITGEIAVFELAQSLDAQAKAAGIVLCPGVGFDVIPTDCVALKLKELMPDATHLSLGFDSRSGFSPGTAKTSIEGMAEGGKVRKDGRITAVALGYKVKQIDFGDGKKQAMTIPWGDVSTAFHTTGIPNVEAFIPAPRQLVIFSKLANWVRPLLGLRAVQDILKAQVDKRVKGPDEQERATMPTFVWGQVRNAQGQSKTVRIKTANPYGFTIDSAVAVSCGLMEKDGVAGAYTPAKLMGSHFVETLPGSGRFMVSQS